jgi:hypothetical protein
MAKHLKVFKCLEGLDREVFYLVLFTRLMDEIIRGVRRIREWITKNYSVGRQHSYIGTI